MRKDGLLTEIDAWNKVCDPILSRFHPQRFFGAISEKMEASV